MITSLRGAREGSRGLMRSSTVTAAMALMLVDAVLGDARWGRGYGQATFRDRPRAFWGLRAGGGPSCPYHLTCQGPTQPKGRGMDDRLRGIRCGSARWQEGEDPTV